jgi:DNA-binding transcriptional regulator YhcF (GntR family)
MAITRHDLKRTINQIIREKKRFPTLQEMADALGFNTEQTKKYMQALEEDGYLEKIGDWYKFSEEKEPSEEPVQEQKVNHLEKITQLVQESEVLGPEKRRMGRPVGSRNKREEDEPKKQITESKSESNFSIPIVKYIMAVIGVGACLLSIYYTWLWLDETLPWFFALILSSIMVCFSVFAFQVILLFLSGEVTKNKIFQFGVSFIFTLLWGAVVIFSMITSIAGQVNEHYKNNVEYSLKKDTAENQE